MTTSPTPAADWIEWTGGENPVPGSIIEWRNAAGMQAEHLSDEVSGFGRPLGVNSPIIAYRVVSPTLASAAKGEGRDYPAEFEAWWATYRHRNSDLASYPLKKQIAFDAFYFAALQPHPSQQAGTEALSEADAKWLSRWLADQKEGGHCGEGNVELRERRHWNDRIDRILSALYRPLSGHTHTAIMNAILADIVRQHPDGFSEDSDAEIVIPSGVEAFRTWVKLDISALAEAALAALNTSEARG